MSKNTITLQQAKDWTSRWRTEDKEGKHEDLKGFLIPADDLIEVLKELKGEKGDRYVRAYLGVNDEDTPKLVIVGTEKAVDEKGNTYYKDLLPAEAETVNADDEGIFDLTRPCPPNCDPTSVLN